MSKHVTIEDLRAPKSKTGFRYVYNILSANDAGNRAGQPFQAQKRIGSNRHGWIGPRRGTAKEAAQDYCDYINGNGVSLAPKLNTASHPRRKKHKMTKAEAEAWRKFQEERAKRKAKEAPPAEHIYLIAETGCSDAVKVGHSSDTRIADLQTGNPRELRLLAKLPGSRDDEQALHARFIHLHEDWMRGEWFRPTPELLSVFDLDEGSPLD